MSSYDLDDCDVCIFFPFRNAGRQSSSPPLCMYLYLAAIGYLAVHLGYHSANNDWRVSLQLFNSHNDVNEHEELDIWPDGKCKISECQNIFRFKHKLIFPEIQFKKRISRNPLLPTSPDQWLKVVLKYEISRDAGKQYSKVR